VSRTPILGLVLAVGLAGRIAGADPLAVRTSGTLPFTQGELEAALALRADLATSDTSTRLVATVSGDSTTAHIAVIGREREVALDHQVGVDAARVVALAVLDLAADQLDPPALAPLVPPAPIVRERAPVATPIAPRGESTWGLGVWGVAGTQLGSPLAGVVELAAPIATDLRATLSVGVPPRSVLGADAHVRVIPLRLAAAWRAVALPLGALELRAGATAAVIATSASRSDTSTIFGGGGAVVWRLPIGAHTGPTIFAGGGVDAFASARDYRVAGMPIGTTDRIAVWAGVGVAGELRR
jgi:hypothetical protein